jgi:hypothetical protein
MTRTLEEAIESLRELPEEEQDAAAAAIFAYISNDERHDLLSTELAGRPASARLRNSHQNIVHCADNAAL